MSFTNFKDTEENKDTLSETVDLKTTELNESDVKLLKIYSSDQKEISIPSLIDLVLLDIKGTSVKNENYDELCMFKMINEDGNITKNAKTYLESTDTKERLKNILND